jgi:hypothetical protein
MAYFDKLNKLRGATRQRAIFQMFIVRYTETGFPVCFQKPVGYVTPDKQHWATHFDTVQEAQKAIETAKLCKLRHSIISSEMPLRPSAPRFGLDLADLF